MAKDARGHGSNKREAWMGKYEDALVSARPELRGKVDWNAATYHFNSGKSPDEAANISASRAAATNTDAASELASGAKSAPIPTHDSMGVGPNDPRVGSRDYDAFGRPRADKSSYDEATNDMRLRGRNGQIGSGMKFRG